MRSRTVHRMARLDPKISKSIAQGPLPRKVHCGELLLAETPADFPADKSPLLRAEGRIHHTKQPPLLQTASGNVRLRFEDCPARALGFAPRRVNTACE